MSRIAKVAGAVTSLVASLVATVSAAQAGCECLTELPLALRQSDLYDEAEGCLYYENAGVRYCYNISYGLNECAAHDEGLDPFCSSFFPPDFCEQSFCFVDSSCSIEPYASSYFPGYGLYYSYKTCGSINSFVAWTGDDVPRSMTDLIALVEAYALSAKQALEENLQQVRDLVDSGNTEECSLDKACNGCTGCEDNDCWEQTINTRRTNVVLNSELERQASSAELEELSCMASYISSTYRRTASKEYNDDGRVAYQYYGSQSTGAMVQWPASGFCSDSFDARQRPWYASAASGPKDVVLVIDVSGSMSGERIKLAKEAAKAVLGTLTWVDHANIVLFNNEIEAKYSSELVTTTEAEIASMRRWVNDNVRASGGTEFEAPLRFAGELLAGSTACSKAILYMTDGEDSTGFDSSTLNSVPSDAVIFSYALGEGAHHAPLQEMACSTGGIFYPVDSENVLADVMASYYEYYVQLADPCAVNWIRYSDAITGAELLGGCSAIFDTLSSETVLQGVNCVDLNIIVEPLQLKTCSNNAYDNFVEMVRSQAATCRAQSSVSGCALKKLRAKVGSSSVCASDSILGTCDGNTNIAFNATSCPAPNSNRFSDIILQDCNAEYESCTAQYYDPPSAAVSLKFSLLCFALVSALLL
ncbi:Inter-alpha-trypsin inhibitor heavy chain H2 [Hondaea fermentalgiana]|uniref:Inter-alpha-trypsin inhibitor heavy chain H2 n=1 Tax=Hondaea fermentalgiana TaxID=2315210 RepID=A0A2R5GWZ2_9STRA|nr:Inter-alpha-trypsin inhibitor heavy chain H2 [Hondaea fermentalgiana]|eukprot:GBG35095.1 Inter-alpha-trypsin inhibitor heavy chain H2 [Hondaea fermentalgiana]